MVNSGIVHNKERRELHRSLSFAARVESRRLKNAVSRDWTILLGCKEKKNILGIRGGWNSSRPRPVAGFNISSVEAFFIFIYLFIYLFSLTYGMRKVMFDMYQGALANFLTLFKYLE
jgi:hypothetical protein